MTNTATIDQDRLTEIAHRKLDAGSHSSIDEGVCIMEAAAYVAGEPWSDHPRCVCPVIASFLRSWNDGLPEDERNTLLKPLLPRIINTNGSKALQKRRALMAADWLVREHTPAWLRLAGLTAQADTLTSLPEITSMSQVPPIRGPLEAIRKDAAAAWAAARDAARDAAWDAARDAACTAAWEAATPAVRATAWDAARAAPWATAWDAARAGAWDAASTAAWAGTDLSPTRKELQQSALALISRMIEATEG